MVNPAQAGYGETRVKEFYRSARERVADHAGRRSGLVELRACRSGTAPRDRW